MIRLGASPFDFDTGCVEVGSYDLGASCVEVEQNKDYGMDASRQLVGKLLPVINILSNRPKIKHFVSFSENLLYFHKIRSIMLSEINTGELVFAG
ncbi:MAG: hypothetical protein SPI19_06355 [Peptoniphilaceae bacterium]|nr:hypothetical protein [Peptoniphilaceae bacterium]